MQINICRNTVVEISNLANLAAARSFRFLCHFVNGTTSLNNCHEDKCSNAGNDNVELSTRQETGNFLFFTLFTSWLR
jgi:hypothetical protein